MILVMLGTQNNNFDRLLNAIEQNIDNGNIKDKVIVQSGFTKFHSDNMEIFKFIEKEKLLELQDEADLIITHGGVGSIISSIKKRKKVLVVPRLKKYGEHVNNHQLQIARKFGQEGYVKYIINLKNLGKILASMDSFEPKVYETNEKNNIVSIVENFIDNN